ncbi:hypothetical protein [Alicyclobacillus fastidiosus]|uniref:Uncharacterized protein n=1 Tax=Alicyclobacillus fastidiosus TaxID=392011 RepID=A0ABV5ALP8_9BACL
MNSEEAIRAIRNAFKQKLLRSGAEADGVRAYMLGYVDERGNVRTSSGGSTLELNVIAQAFNDDFREASK